jgi:hypothetical protein
LAVRPFAEAKGKVENGEQRDLFGEYLQRWAMAAATEGGGAARALAGRAGAPLATQLLQRAPLTVEAADGILEINAHGIWSVDHQIIDPAGEDDFDLGNCHGYTKTGQHPVNSGAFAAIGVALKAGKSIAIFYRNESIAHSGVLDGNNLYHYVKGVGVVLSPNSAAELFGYTKRYNLPESMDTWIEENDLTKEEVDSWGVEFTPEQKILVDRIDTFLNQNRWDNQVVEGLYNQWEDVFGIPEILAFIETNREQMVEAGLDLT